MEHANNKAKIKFAKLPGHDICYARYYDTC
jgi:hypothetical protein